MPIDPQDDTIEETKYTLKVDNPESETPQEPIGDLEGDFDIEGGEEEPFGEMPDGEANDKPFDDEPFEAGVEADEDVDPEKFIQQLSGKLGTSLRKYTDERGEPDFDLEKFAINSVISATHTAEMDEEDQKDIIKKIKTSGKGENDVDVDVNVDTGKDDNEIEGGIDTTDDNENVGDEENFEENLKNLEKSGIFEGDKIKNTIMDKIKEGFDIDGIIDEVLGDHMDTDTEPTIKPDEETIIKPDVKPDVKEKPRREKIWSPNPGTSPDPKAEE